MKKILSLCLILLSIQQVHAQLTWSFPPTTISSSGVNSSNVEVGMDANGNGVAIWLENGFVKTSSLPLGGSWSGLTVLSNSGATAPQLAVDPAGNSTAIWLEGSTLKTAVSPVGGSWGAATTLDSSGASAPQIAADASGDLVAIWVSSGAIKSSTKASGGSWQAIADLLALIGTSPQVSIGANQTVYAVWHANNPISDMDAVYAVSKTIGGSWGSAVAVSNPNQNCNYPNITVDGSGNATAVWFSYNEIGSQYIDVIVQAAQFITTNFTWTAPVNISYSGIANPANLSLCIDCSSIGNVLALWTNCLDGENFVVETASIGLNSQWTAPLDLFVDPYAFSANIGMAADGNATVVSMISVSSGSLISIQSAETNLGSLQTGNWENFTILSNGSNNGYPKVAVVNMGTTTRNGVAAWESYDGSNTVINAVQTSAALLQAPTNLTVTQASTNFNVYTDYYNTISWLASASPAASGYLIYRNNMLIGQVNSTQTQFIDHNQIQNGSVTYGVSTVDSTFEQSIVSFISFP